MLPPAPAPPPNSTAAFDAAFADDDDGADGGSADEGAGLGAAQPFGVAANAGVPPVADAAVVPGTSSFVSAATLLPHAPLPAPVLCVQRTYGLSGHLVIEDFMSVTEEAELVGAVEAPSEPPWVHSSFNGRSRGKSWGVVMDLGCVLSVAVLGTWPLVHGAPSDLRLAECPRRQRAVFPAVVPFPAWLAPLVERLRRVHPMLARFDPNHANAIEYIRARGDYLVPHVDDRQLSGDLIVNLSLAGESVMTYVPEPRGGAPRGIAARRAGDKPPPAAPGTVRVPLPRRCAQVQSGAARFEFTHGIWSKDLHAPKRISITLRESPITHPRAPPPPGAERRRK